MVHVITEAEKSHDPPSASWRLRKARSVIQSKSKGLRSRETKGVNPSPRAGKDEERVQLNSETGQKRG